VKLRGVPPELLDQIPPNRKIASVKADGVFDACNCHDAMAARGAAKITPHCRNPDPSTPDSPGAVARNEAFRASKRFCRINWRRWSGFRRRSRVETKIHCLEVPVERLAARDFGRQAGELQVRVAIVNGFTAFGMPVTKVAD
jgi:hypothetical protein